MPRSKAPVRFSGKIEDPALTEVAARTGGFLNAAGETARPYSEARFSWRDGTLYIMLYAADEDIVAPEKKPDQPLTHDHFELTFPGAVTDDVLEVTPRGVLTDGRRTHPEAGSPASFDPSWSSGAAVLADAEESVDNPHDEDEEWIVEMTVPLTSLGHAAVSGERIQLAIARCDIPKNGVVSCGDWGRSPAVTLVLDDP